MVILEETLIGILQKCRQTKDPWHARHLQASLLDQDHGLLQTLSLHQEHSSTSLIFAHINRGRPHRALQYYHKMQEAPDPVQPNLHAYLALLNASARLKDEESGCTLHAEIIKRGWESVVLGESSVSGNTLVGMYGKNGSYAEASHVFDRLPLRNVVSWNALIAGFAEYGCSEEASTCLQEMQQGGVSPNAVTLICIFKACATAAALETGHVIHAETVKRGWEGELHVGSALVDMYTKCDSLKDAPKIFDRLTVQNEVLWNALIAGYAEHGLCEEAKKCIQRMQHEGVAPDYVTFMLSLKACSTCGALQMGLELHAELLRRGLEGELTIGSTLVEMYIKCHSHMEAWKVFDRLPVRDVIAWDALLGGYAKYGTNQEVSTCFQQMQLEGIAPDSFTFVQSLKACATMGVIETGQVLHDEASKRGLESELHVGSILVDMYTKCGSLIEAQQVFDKLPRRNAFSWSALIGGYAEHGFGEKARNCFKEMQLEATPGSATFVCSLKACSAIRALKTCWGMHSDIIKLGLDKELNVGNALVDTYTKCSLLADAQQVFDNLPVRDAASWAALVAGYAEHGDDEKVLDCFRWMQRGEVCPDAITFVLCLKSCGALGALKMGREIHSEARKSGLERDLCVGSMLVYMYGKCCSIAEGWEVFSTLPLQNIVSWNTMINALGENHQGNMAVQCFEDMQEKGVRPDTITFKCLLASCSRTSLVTKGQEYFMLMKEKYEIEPVLDHYACVVDLCARSGHVHDAERFAAATQCPPCIEIFLGLLSACKMYGKAGLGQRCFQHIMGMSHVRHS